MEMDMKKKQEKEDALRHRYRELYGEAAHEERYKSDMKAIRTRYLLVAAVFILAICFSVHEHAASVRAVNEKGGSIISITRPEKGEESFSIDLDVSASDGKATVRKGKVLIVGPEGKDEGSGSAVVMGEESDEEKLARKIDSAVRSAGQEGNGRKIILPSRLEDGTRLVWKLAADTQLPLLITALVIMMGAVYRTRTSGIEKAEKEAKASVSREMPAFMNKILLLTDGGLVLTEALDRAVCDAKRRGLGERSYFYMQMIEIKEGSERSNIPLSEGLTSFAGRSGVRELMRFASMVTDNIEKGADISDKLEAEGRMLWFMRKKKAEEAGRIAETKLSIPLMLLVLDLIGVTCAPALLQM